MSVCWKGNREKETVFLRILLSCSRLSYGWPKMLAGELVKLLLLPTNPKCSYDQKEEEECDSFGNV